MAPSHFLLELATYLAADGIGLTATTNLFVGYMPEGLTLRVALLPYPGPASEHDLGTDNVRHEKPRFQVAVDGPDFAAAWLQAQKIEKSFIKVINENLSGVYYLAVMPLGSIFHIGRDKNQAWMIRQNFEAEKSPSPTS